MRPASRSCRSGSARPRATRGSERSPPAASVEGAKLRIRPRLPAACNSRALSVPCMRAGAPSERAGDHPEHERRDDPAIPDVVAAEKASHRSRRPHFPPSPPAPFGSFPALCPFAARRRSGPRKERSRPARRTRSPRGARSSSRRSSRGALLTPATLSTAPRPPDAACDDRVTSAPVAAGPTGPRLARVMLVLFLSHRTSLLRGSLQAAAGRRAAGDRRRRPRRQRWRSPTRTR
jgi:hypothetical protein